MSAQGEGLTQTILSLDGFILGYIPDLEVMCLAVIPSTPPATPSIYIWVPLSLRLSL